MYPGFSFLDGMFSTHTSDRTKETVTRYTMLRRAFSHVNHFFRHLLGTFKVPRSGGDDGEPMSWTLYVGCFTRDRVLPSARDVV